MTSGKKMTGCQILAWDSVHFTFSCRRNGLNMLYLKYLMGISELHKRSIKVSSEFVCISPCNEFSVFHQLWKWKRGRVTCFLSIGRAYLIQLLHILTWRGQWKSFENQWAEASKTKIIDCFQTPAGSRITNQKQLPGMSEIGFANPSATYPNEEKW